MDAGRALADEQGLGDPAVGVALGYQGEDLTLACGQAERVGRPGGSST